MPDIPSIAYEAQFAAECGMTLSQMLSGQEFPISDQIVWKWEHGKSLVPPDELDHLPTQMGKLHKWYMEVAKAGREVLIVQVTKEHFAGADEIKIYLEELYQLYKIDALDLSIVSTYCL